MLDLSVMPITTLADAEPWLGSAWLVYPVLVVAGFVAGIINTIAGGGSFLTLPVLMYVGGLDPKIANGTNRIAILTSTVSATGVFHRAGLIDRTAMLRILLPAIFGVPLGALLAIYLPPDLFRGLFGATFLAMAVFFLFNPKAMLRRDRQPIGPRWVEAVYFFFTGVYVGFIQAGLGVMLLVGMSLFHARELVSANAIKNVIAFLVTLVGTLIFVFAGQVKWGPGLTMAAGNVLGGIAGAHLAIRRGEKLIFAFLILVMTATGVKLLLEAF